MNDYFEELGLGNDLIFDICGIDDENESIGTSIIARPDGPNPFLPSQIPG